MFKQFRREPEIQIVLRNLEIGRFGILELSFVIYLELEILNL